MTKLLITLMLIGLAPPDKYTQWELHPSLGIIRIEKASNGSKIYYAYPSMGYELFVDCGASEGVLEMSGNTATLCIDGTRYITTPEPQLIRRDNENWRWIDNK